MLAVLDTGDYIGLAILGLLLMALARSPSVIFRPGDQAWRRRIESKLDAIIANLGIQAPDPGAASGLSTGVRQLADAGQKIQAIKLHREETGLGLKEANDAVEAYMGEDTK
jgi:hypothetical protein